jgi:hypothetical protein
MRAEIHVDLHAMYQLFGHLVPGLEVTEYFCVQFSNTFRENPFSRL